MAPLHRPRSSGSHIPKSRDVILNAAEIEIARKHLSKEDNPAETPSRGFVHGKKRALRFLFAELLADTVRARNEFFEEVQLLTTLNHPNVDPVKAVCVNPLCVVAKYFRLGSVRELLNGWGNCFLKATKHVPWLLQEKKSLLEEWFERIKLVSGIASGMHYLHGRNKPIIHGELKSTNVYLKKGHTPVVSDFGMARYRFKDQEKNVQNPRWMAPEVAVDGQEPTTKSDVYSFAIIMWEVLTGSTPWGGAHPKHILRLVTEGLRLPVPDRLPKNLPGIHEYVDLMKKCWAQNPDDRPDFQSIVESLDNIWKKAFHKSGIRQLEDIFYVINTKDSSIKGRKFLGVESMSRSLTEFYRLEVPKLHKILVVGKAVGSIPCKPKPSSKVSLQELQRMKHPAIPLPQHSTKKQRRFDFVLPDDPCLGPDHPRATLRVINDKPPNQEALLKIRKYVVGTMKADTTIQGFPRWMEAVHVVEGWDSTCESIGESDWGKLLSIVFGSEGVSDEDIRSFRTNPHWEELKGLLAQDMVPVLCE